MKEYKYFIDTNIFIRFLTADNDKMHKACVRLMKRIEDREIEVCTSNFVFAEIHWVLHKTYGYSKSEVIDVLQHLRLLRSLHIVDEVNQSVALSMYEGAKVKYIDALIASNPDIQSRKVTIVSYDKDFDKLGVRRVTPDGVK